MARMRVMREGDLGEVAWLEEAAQVPSDTVAKLKALIRSSEIKAVVCNGLGKRIEPGMDDKQTSGAKMRHFYMIDSQKADEILNA